MKRLSAPLDAQIELTESCNQKCFHCYNYWRYDEEIGKNEIKEEDFLLIAKKLHNAGIKSITLTGGEPFLRPRIVFSILQFCKDNGIKVGINSNAVLIGKRYAEKISELGATHVLVSLLGTKNTHNKITNSNTFDNACDGIKNLINAGLSVSVNMAVSKLNLHEIYEVGKMAKDFSATTFCATPIVPSHESHKKFLLSGEECKQALRTLLKVRDELACNVDTLEPVARCLFNENDEDEFVYFFGNRICSAAVTTCAISSTGSVRPCIHADKEFGNLLYENFSEIWEKMKTWSSPDILPSGCKSCKAVVICEGGCRMSAKLTCGRYNGNDMYMRGPIFDIERVKKLPFCNKEAEESLDFSEKTYFKLNDSLDFRKEDFGGIVYVNNRAEFLTDRGWELLLNLKSKNVFSAESLKEEFKLVSDSINVFIGQLYKNKIIRKGGDKVE
ncbi:MAG: radical SAM protein [Candidatus Paceibacter sp.]|nr:radical SAM protein [Candidatus Paceibacter sp.]